MPAERTGRGVSAVTAFWEPIGRGSVSPHALTSQGCFCPSPAKRVDINLQYQEVSADHAALAPIRYISDHANIGRNLKRKNGRGFSTKSEVSPIRRSLSHLRMRVSSFHVIEVRCLISLTWFNKALFSSTYHSNKGCPFHYSSSGKSSFLGVMKSIRIERARKNIAVLS